jgi:hypothetical protein
MPTLVILAAGLGSRFGGDKQTAPRGAGGASLMEYGIYDALRAGFGRIVVVVRPEMVVKLGASLRAKVGARASLECVGQLPTDLPAGFACPPARTKPWGTGHAVLAARRAVRESFAVANADDFYGADAYASLARFFAEPPAAGAPAYALIGFPLRGTLSASGPVNRAICRSDDNGWLERIEERNGLTAANVDAQRIGGALVSMNLWGFTPDLFAQLETDFTGFLQHGVRDDSAEFLLPNAIQSLIALRSARVKLIPSSGGWCGVTYAADAPLVTAHLAELTKRGEYPRDLWG